MVEKHTLSRFDSLGLCISIGGALDILSRASKSRYGVIIGWGIGSLSAPEKLKIKIRNTIYKTYIIKYIRIIKIRLS